MDNKNDNHGFTYTYSAKDQEELKRIRQKYISSNEDKMERLRRLDRRVTEKAQAVSLVFGIIGALLLGLGMSLVMTEFGEMLGSHRDMAMPIGIVTGMIGGALACFAYPIYNHILKHERKKIAPEILKLTDELLKK
ncbi:MAG: hypothetical protein IJW55_01920 [Clostridia bacterium]|nr:hypothetical protein [Clostridia bacterium]